MKFLRRFAVIFFASFGVIILTGVLLGIIFQDKIHVAAIRELEKALNADIYIAKTDVSFLRSFPKVAVELQDLQLNPVESESERDFIRTDEAVFKVDLWSFFSDSYQINGVYLNHPEVYLEKDKEGNYNYRDIFKIKKEVEDQRAERKKVLLELEKIEIEDGWFLYADLRRNDHIEVDHIDLAAKGTFADQIAEMDLDGEFRMSQLVSAGTTYLRDRDLTLSSHMLLDLTEIVTIDLSDGVLTSGPLALDVFGKLDDQGEEFYMDIAFSSNKNSFDSFLGLLPPGLIDLGTEYNYTGKFILDGYIRGITNSTSAPDVYAAFKVDDGTFQYEGYEARLEAINMNGHFLYNPEEEQKAELIIPEFRGSLNSHQLEGKFHYRDFVDGSMDFSVKGEVELTDVMEFYPSFPEGTRLAGLLELDIRAKGKMDDFRNEKFRDVLADGSIGLEGITFAHPTFMYPLDDVKGLFKVNNRTIEVDHLNGRSGQTDFALSGTVNSYLPYLFDSTGTMAGRFEFDSKNIDLNQLLREDDGETNPDDDYRLSLPDRLNLQLTADIGNLKVKDFEAKQVRGQVHLHDRQIDLSDLRMQTLEGSARINGKLVSVSDTKMNTVIQAQWEDLNVNKTLVTFNQWADMTLLDDKMYGIFSGQLDLQGSLNEQLELDEPSLQARGLADIREGRIVDYEPLRALAGFVKLEKLRDVHFEDVHAEFEVEDAHFIVPGIQLQALDYKMDIRGRHGFDQTLDYYLRVEMPPLMARKSTNPKISELISEEPTESKGIIIPLHITGTVDDPHFTIDGKQMKEGVKQQLAQQKEDLREGSQEEIREVFGEQDTTDVDDWILEEGRDKKKAKPELFKNLRNPFRKKGRKDEPSDTPNPSPDEE